MLLSDLHVLREGPILKFSAVLACLTGIILAVAATAINWGGAETELYYLVVLPYFRLAVYIAAVLLAVGGMITLARLPRGPALLSGAWGFVLGMSFLCIAPYLWIPLDLKENPEMAEFVRAYLISTGAATVVALIGFASVVVDTKR